MKGIILAGGAGSRLYPMTSVVTKQLQPVYDKPMVYYPLSLLMLCGIRDILVISTPHDLPMFKHLLGTGQDLGIKLSYMEQQSPNGIAEAFILGEKFIDGDNVTLILGDNLFFGIFDEFRDSIKAADKDKKCKARIFAYKVSDPSRYGVVDFDHATRTVSSIEEKPLKPKSNYAIPGLYILDASACPRAKKQRPSKRGELEITDLLQSYLDEKLLSVNVIGRGMAWFDTGTPQSLLEASSFIGAIEQRQGLKVACLEEIALRMQFITLGDFDKLIKSRPNCPYREYLLAIAKDVEAEKP